MKPPLTDPEERHGRVHVYLKAKPSYTADASGLKTYESPPKIKLRLSTSIVNNTTSIPEQFLRGRPLRNTTCPYCGQGLADRSRTKEHVIGRRFVPVGSLNNTWNLILWACAPCNRRKADLEDDISAITMNYHSVGLHPMADSRLQVEAKRRSLKSGSRKTGKAVAHSHVSIRFAAPVSEFACIKGNLNAPPQIDGDRVYELARMQIVALFYFLTYDHKSNTGHYWRGGFFPVHGTVKSDWGNPVHQAIMTATASWDYRLILNTADGYFRTVIRKHPSKECWSWAVEWNDCYRLVGFCGDQSASQAVAFEFPHIPFNLVFEAPGQWLRYRNEEPLDETYDVLFRQTESPEA